MWFDLIVNDVMDFSVVAAKDISHRYFKDTLTEVSVTNDIKANRVVVITPLEEAMYKGRMIRSGIIEFPAALTDRDLHIVTECLLNSVPTHRALYNFIISSDQCVFVGRAGRKPDIIPLDKLKEVDTTKDRILAIYRHRNAKSERVFNPYFRAKPVSALPMQADYPTAVRLLMNGQFEDSYLEWCGYQTNNRLVKRHNLTGLELAYHLVCEPSLGLVWRIRYEGNQIVCSGENSMRSKTIRFTPAYLD